MNFGIVLYIMYAMMKWGTGFTALINKDFKKLLKKKNFTTLIITKDGKYGRSFTFNNGKITSKTGVNQNADLKVIWKDGQTAIKTMKKGGDQQVLMDAIVDGDLLFEGSAAVMMRFILIMTQMMEVYGIGPDKMRAGKKEKIPCCPEMQSKKSIQ
ncbi:MAG: hypothetical protein KJ737_03845 [Proteobacteria bacterium]|nr:hypothetical protein [Pseudomonadota bacterium]